MSIIEKDLLLTVVAILGEDLANEAGWLGLGNREFALVCAFLAQILGYPFLVRSWHLLGKISARTNH